MVAFLITKALPVNLFCYTIIMTKELFTRNIQSSSISLFFKAIVATSVFIIVLDLVLVAILGGKYAEAVWGSDQISSFDPLKAISLAIFLILFYICLRGFVGHLKPVVAFKNTFVFFFILNFVLGTFEILANEQTLIYGIVLMFTNALTNAVPAYFLGKAK